VHTITRFRPINFANNNLPLRSFSSVAELYCEQITLQDYCYSMKGIAMPGGHLSRRKLHPPNLDIPSMMYYLLIPDQLHG